MDNLPLSTAFFRVIQDIEVYSKVGGLKKEWSRLAAEIFAMTEICLSRNKAVTSLLKLQNYGVADDEILTVYEFLNEAGLENAASHEFHFANGSSTDNANSLHITNMDWTSET